MSIAEIISAARALPQDDKRKLAQTLLDDLAIGEPEAAFREGHVYHVYTPEFGPDAVSKLAKVLEDHKKSR